MVERLEKPFNIFQKVRKTRFANILEKSVLEKLSFLHGRGWAGGILLT